MGHFVKVGNENGVFKFPLIEEGGSLSLECLQARFPSATGLVYEDDIVIPAVRGIIRPISEWKDTTYSPHFPVEEKREHEFQIDSTPQVLFLPPRTEETADETDRNYRFRIGAREETKTEPTYTAYQSSLKLENEAITPEKATLQALKALTDVLLEAIKELKQQIHLQGLHGRQRARGTTTRGPCYCCGAIGHLARDCQQRWGRSQDIDYSKYVQPGWNLRDRCYPEEHTWEYFPYPTAPPSMHEENDVEEQRSTHKQSSSIPHQMQSTVGEMGKHLQESKGAGVSQSNSLSVTPTPVPDRPEDVLKAGPRRQEMTKFVGRMSSVCVDNRRTATELQQAPHQLPSKQDQCLVQSGEVPKSGQMEVESMEWQHDKSHFENETPTAKAVLETEPGDVLYSSPVSASARANDSVNELGKEHHCDRRVVRQPLDIPFPYVARSHARKRKFRPGKPMNCHEKRGDRRHTGTESAFPLGIGWCPQQPYCLPEFSLRPEWGGYKRAGHEIRAKRYANPWYI